MNKVVSIITPSFNRAHIVGETAASIFEQTYPYWEWVIVDDGSTDNSHELLRELAGRDPRVKVFDRDREPKGACTCRNIAVEKCTGAYLIFLDTDDLMAPFCLEQRVQAAMESPDADFIIFPMLLFESKPFDKNLLWNIDKDEDDILRILRGDAICQGTGTIWKKDSFIRSGMWDENLRLWQDIDLHLRAMLGGYKYVKRMDLKPDIHLRVSDTSLSRSGFHSLPKLKSRILVFERVLETISMLGKMDIYRKGLRLMGRDLLLNAIHSNYPGAATQLISLIGEYNIFVASEITVLKNYALLRRSRLYKLSFLNNRFEKKVNDLEQRPVSSLGTVGYKGMVSVVPFAAT